MRLHRYVAGLACAALALALIPRAAKADIYSLHQVGSRAMSRFDANGRFVEMVPAGIESSEGIAVTPDGWVYTNGNGLGAGAIARAPVGGPFDWQPVTPFDMNGPFTVPMGMTAGPDGRVYATSTAFRPNGRSGVFRYDRADGSFVQVVSAADPDPTRPFNTLNFAVAVSPAGDIYLARSNLGVERYDGRTGTLVGLVVPATAGAPTISDIEFGPDGNLYVPTAEGVDRYHPLTGAFLGQFIPNGSGGLNGALDLSFGDDGHVYVNSPASSIVLRYDAVTGAFHDVFIPPAEYDSAPSDLRQIVYVVPEPGGAMALAGAAIVGVLRRGKGH